MPIRPIDLQTMIPKVQEHRQSKDSTVNQSDTDQQQSNIKNKQLVDQKQRQVNRMDRRDQMRIRDEGKRRKEGDSSREKEQEAEACNGSEIDGQQSLSDAESGESHKESPEKSAYDKEKKLKSLQYHKFDMKV